jgi:hypothetical protein
MLCQQQGDGKGLIEHTQQVLLLAPSQSDECVPDELLYGRSGYLFCLLALRDLAAQFSATGTKNAGKEEGAKWETLLASITTGIDDMFDQLVIRGRDFARKQGMTATVPLMYAWHEKMYLGGFACIKNAFDWRLTMACVGFYNLGAHGLAGVVAVMLQVGGAKTSGVLKELMQCVDFLANQRLSSVSYPFCQLTESVSGVISVGF